MSLVKNSLRRLLERRGLVVHRWPTTRFDGMEQSLRLLRDRGYFPGVVLDCGANVGQWFRLAHSVFPDAAYHLFEPQPPCVAALETLRSAFPQLTIHATALTEPDVASVRMIGGDAARTGTGNFVAVAGEHLPDEVVVNATTLDELLGARLRREDRALLKLDVERHEVAVLSGATRVLERIEVVLSETGVYDVAGNRPTFSDLMRFMGEHGFQFYDVACLSGRSRDLRLRQMDVIFVRNDSPLVTEHTWE